MFKLVIMATWQCLENQTLDLQAFLIKKYFLILRTFRPIGYGWNIFSNWILTNEIWCVNHFSMVIGFEVWCVHHFLMVKAFGELVLKFLWLLANHYSTITVFDKLILNIIEFDEPFLNYYYVWQNVTLQLWCLMICY